MPKTPETPAIDLVVEGSLDRHTVPRWHAELAGSVRQAAGAPLRLDLSRVTSMDSAGAALCEVLRSQAERQGGRLVLSAAAPAASEALSLPWTALLEVQAISLSAFTSAEELT